VSKKNRKYGHRRFYEILEEEAELHAAKNRDYTRGGDPLGNAKRVAAILSLYPGLDPSKPEIVFMIYALKQLDAFLWMSAGDYEGSVEGRGERLADISVYGKLIRIICEEQDAGK